MKKQSSLQELYPLKAKLRGKGQKKVYAVISIDFFSEEVELATVISDTIITFKRALSQINIIYQDKRLPFNKIFHQINSI